MEYTAGSVRINDLERRQDHYLTPGQQLVLDFDGAYFNREYGPFRVEFTANAPEVEASPDGRSASGSVSALTIEATYGPLDRPRAVVRMDLQTVRASATAPPGGVEPCTPPRIVQPTDGQKLADPSVAFAGTGAPNAVLELVIDGRAAERTAVASPDGRWSMPPLLLPPGRHHAFVHETLDAHAVDSKEIAFDIGEPDVAAPTLIRPAEDAVTEERRPRIEGRAPIDSTVRVWVDAQIVGTARADAAGAFALTPAFDLTSGDHEVWAEAFDRKGRRSPPSASRAFTIRAVEPPSVTPTASPTPSASATPRPISRPSPVTPSHDERAVDPRRLAATGGPPLLLAVVGASLLCMGACCFIVARGTGRLRHGRPRRSGRGGPVSR